MKGLSRLCNLTIWVHFQRKEVTHQTFFPVVRSTSRRICLNRKEPEWMKGLSRLCNLTIWVHFQRKEVTHQTFFPVVRSTSRRICLNRKEPEWMKGLSRLCNLTIWANFQSKQRKQAIKRSSLLLVGRYPAARSWTKKTLFFCIHDVSSRDRGKEVLHVNAFVAMCHFHTYLPTYLL